MPQTKKQLLFLISVTFVAKFFLGLYFSHLATCQEPIIKFGYLALAGGDTFSYLGAMDNLLEHREYYFWNGARNVYAGRMPYYGLPYFILRLFFNKAAAADIFVGFQIGLDALATVLFARLCFKFLPSKAVFWIGYAIYFCSFSLFLWNITLLTEGLSHSLFVGFLYFYHRFWIDRKWFNAVLASMLLALMTVLKPYLILLYPVFLLGIILRGEKPFEWASISIYFRQTIILSLPLLILLAPWIIRNAIVLKDFIPAQENIYAGYAYSAADFSFSNFVGSWGGGVIYWDTNDSGCYFVLNPPLGCDYKTPPSALTNGYDINDIEQVRRNYLKLQANYSLELEKDVVAEFERLTIIYRHEKPFMYYVGSKFVILKKLFWHTNNHQLMIHPSFKCYNPLQMSFKIVQFVIYIFAFTFGIFGILKLVYERKISFLFLAVPIVIALLFAELRSTEPRYVSHVYVILLFGIPISFLALSRVLKVYWYKLQRKNRKNINIVSPHNFIK